MSDYQVANEIIGVGKTEDYPDEYFKGFNKALPKSELVNQDYENIFSDGRDMSNNLIGNIVDWFKAAKPEPTKKDICTQLGVNLEEVSEMASAINANNLSEIIGEAATYLKKANEESLDKYIKDFDDVELLDALCDQIVTAVGVGYMMGFDVEGALKEVIRSNNSKMVDGKFIFDENSKIAKPDTFSEPDLKPYLNNK